MIRYSETDCARTFRSSSLIMSRCSPRMFLKRIEFKLTEIDPFDKPLEAKLQGKNFGGGWRALLGSTKYVPQKEQSFNMDCSQ